MTYCKLALMVVVSWSAATLAVADEPGPIPQKIWVRAVSGATTFYQDFCFEDGAGVLPGITSGMVQAGGLGIQEVVKSKPVHYLRTVYVNRLVLINGRPRIIQVPQTREYVEYVQERSQQEITLPLVTGHWTSAESAPAVLWTIFHSSAEGTVIGTGTVEGGILRGSALYSGVAGIPSGVYSLSNVEG